MFLASLEIDAAIGGSELRRLPAQASILTISRSRSLRLRVSRCMRLDDFAGKRRDAPCTRTIQRPEEIPSPLLSFSLLKNRDPDAGIIPLADTAFLARSLTFSLRAVL